MRRRRLRIPLPPPDQNRARVNERIRVPQVLLIDQDGQKVGIIPVDEARARAEAAQLDLVEVAATARPPVCRIMDFGKYLFEQQKKDRVQKRNQQTHDAKGIRLRPGTGPADLELKAKHAREFLMEGFKVAIQLQFKGRERAHPELGVEMILKFADSLKDVGKLEQEPKQEGKRMNALLAPTGKKAAAPTPAPAPAPAPEPADQAE